MNMIMLVLLRMHGSFLAFVNQTWSGSFPTKNYNSIKNINNCLIYQYYLFNSNPSRAMYLKNLIIFSKEKKYSISFVF